MAEKIKIIGGGLAGCECAYQLLKRGYAVDLYEMRPTVQTPAHKTSDLAELVCSNSLKSTDFGTSQGLLKREMKLLGSMVLRVAESVSVPAGGALAVDRSGFSAGVEKELSLFCRLKIIREEVTSLDSDSYTVVAAGPLASEKLCGAIGKLTGTDSLHFYDAVAPIVTAESVDRTESFFAGRYGKGGDDYLNCPMNREEYYAFCDALCSAETVILKEFEKRDVFNACMPIEIIAKSGRDSMRFGPLRPVGIVNPSDGVRPFAVVQLRKEDNFDNLYNIVGFQTNLKFGEQKRVFGMIPALADAEYARYGVMHRNTFIDAPKSINADFSCKNDAKIFFGGQISGVEGYLESAASGLMCAVNIDRNIRGMQSAIPGENTAIGSLMRYISATNTDFEPMHVSYSLMPELGEKIRNKQERKLKYSERAIEDMENYVRITDKE
jgi:methylenetetrahydrofolate--tRNA-(uracil-5-)-methyltransferase